MSGITVGGGRRRLTGRWRGGPDIFLTPLIAVLFRDLIMKQETVTFDHRKYQRFYNPMLNYISEDDSNYGSLYYASGLKTLYWYCYDQILMRKALVNRLLDVSYRKSIKGRKLLNEISPNKNISDHLPLIVKFERRTNDE